MATFDDIDRKKAAMARLDEDRLAKIGKEWFAEAKAQTAQEDADTESWKRSRRKWPWRSSYDAPDFSGGADGSGGDNGGD